MTLAQARSAQDICSEHLSFRAFPAYAAIVSAVLLIALFVSPLKGRHYFWIGFFVRLFIVCGMLGLGGYSLHRKIEELCVTSAFNNTPSSLLCHHENTTAHNKFAICSLVLYVMLLALLLYEAFFEKSKNHHESVYRPDLTQSRVMESDVIHVRIGLGTPPVSVEWNPFMTIGSLYETKGICELVRDLHQPCVCLRITDNPIVALPSDYIEENFVSLVLTYTMASYFHAIAEARFVIWILPFPGNIPYLSGDNEAKPEQYLLPNGEKRIRCRLDDLCLIGKCTKKQPHTHLLDRWFELDAEYEWEIDGCKCIAPNDDPISFIGDYWEHLQDGDEIVVSNGVTNKRLLRDESWRRLPHLMPNEYMV